MIQHRIKLTLEQELVETRWDHGRLDERVIANSPRLITNYWTTMGGRNDLEYKEEFEETICKMTEDLKAHIHGMTIQQIFEYLGMTLETREEG